MGLVNFKCQKKLIEQKVRVYMSPTVKLASHSIITKIYQQNEDLQLLAAEDNSYFIFPFFNDPESFIVARIQTKNLDLTVK